MRNGRRHTGIAWLSASDPPDAFPPVAHALENPNGLLAAGGDLSAERLLTAYPRGIFPWYEDGQPILWWSPDPRAVLRPAELRVSRRLARTLRQGTLQCSADSAFDQVIANCAEPRRYGGGTWITAEMAAAYQALHRSGWCHSVEVWADDRLVGGIYGLAIGRVFFGESMFSRRRDASKIALAHLCAYLQQQDYVLLDCQDWSAHLQSLGATLIPRAEFVAQLQQFCQPQGTPGSWREPFAQFLHMPQCLAWRR